MRVIIRGFIAFTIIFAALSRAYGVLPDEILSNPALEARARDISAHLRCLVCQNESIDDSGAPLARDLRILVRERLKAGDSDRQVIDFLVARYGEFVLLKPRLNEETLLLWLAPLFIIIIAAGAIFWRIRHNGHNKVIPLSNEEKKRLEQILKAKKH